MKVLRYYPRARTGDGGITASVRSSAKAMAGLGAEVTVVYDGAPAEPTIEHGVRYAPVRHVAGGRVPVGLQQWVTETDVVVLHSAWTPYNVAAADMSRRRGVPYVLEPRGAYDPHIVRRKRGAKALWWQLGEGRTVRQAAAVHVFFGAEEAHLAALGYRGPTITVPNGVEVPQARCWDGGSGEYLLWLGRFDPEHKGLDMLLHAMGRIPEARRPWLRLCGPDWQGRKGDVAGLVKDLGLRHWVEIGPPAYGDAKLATMAAARAFVYPSRWEAFGNSVAEAAALGVPVLTTTFPLGCHLADHRAGVAVDPTADSLAAGIEQVLGAGAGAMGARARRLVEDELRWDTVAKSWLDQVHAVI